MAPGSVHSNAHRLVISSAIALVLPMPQKFCSQGATGTPFNQSFKCILQNSELFQPNEQDLMRLRTFSLGPVLSVCLP